MSAERVWFIGPWEAPGFFLRASDEPGRSQRVKGVGPRSAPPNFPWDSMDRGWSAVYYPAPSSSGIDAADSRS